MSNITVAVALWATAKNPNVVSLDPSFSYALNSWFTAFMRTGPGEHDIHFLSMSYLSLYADNAIVPYSQLFFIPEETPPVESPSLKGLSKKKEAFVSICLIESQRRKRGMPGYIY